MAKQWFVCVLCLLCAASISFAQTDRGVITGTVRDATGAVVPGAQVTATHVATNTSFKANTTSSGDFTVPSLPVGAYQVRVENSGFKTPGTMFRSGATGSPRATQIRTLEWRILARRVSPGC